MTQDQMAKSKPFLGVPISTKDSLCVKGMVNASGWYYRKDVKADDDTPAIANMRKAGAIPFCLTNVPELCLWFESNNTVFGRSKNPYDTYRTVGGSSGKFFFIKLQFIKLQSNLTCGQSFNLTLTFIT